MLESRTTARLPTPAYGYPRVSSKRQTRGHGIKRQREIIGEFAEKNGYTIVGWYDEAYTGTESERPEFVRMLDDMLANGVRTIIVESLDRFSRALMVQNTLLAKLASEEITLIAANTGEDVTEAMSDDPMRWAMVQMQGIFAELDKRQVVRKLRLAREAKRKARQKCEGQHRYGQHPDKPEEAKCLRRMRELALQTDSPTEISRILNGEGFRPRRGRRWYPSTVRRILDRDAAPDVAAPRLVQK